MGAWTKHELIGTGGSARAHRATRHVIRDRYQEACWKELREELRTDSESLEYFRREAAIAAELRHNQNIVSLIEAHLEEHYLIYELVSGCDLRRVMDEAGPLSVPLAIHIAIEACKGLEHAHTHTRDGAPAGIIHRDLCPKNILISHAGEVMLMDFGIAAPSNEQPTMVRGKPAYMSPEQAGVRQAAETLDGRSDLYSLGVILFEILTGRLPSAPWARGNFQRTQEQPAAELPCDVPPALATLIMQMMHESPNDRPASADACIDALAPLAPSPQTRKELGKLSRRAYERQTKNYGAMRAARSSSPPNSLPEPATPRPTPKPDWRRRTVVAATLVLAALVAFVAAPESRPVATAVDRQHAEPASKSDGAPTTLAMEPSSPPAVPNTTISASLTADTLAEPARALAPAGGTTATSARRTPAAAAASAMLHITAAPPAQIWIDKRSFGSSPVHARVAAGPHVIVAGSQRRRVTLRPDAEHDEFFDLTHTGT